MHTLDSTKALNQLGRSDRLSIEEAIEWTMRWSKEVGAGRDHWDVAQKQALHLRIVLARIPLAERDRRRLAGGQAMLPGSAIGEPPGSLNLNGRLVMTGVPGLWLATRRMPWMTPRHLAGPGLLARFLAATLAREQ